MSHRPVVLHALREYLPLTETWIYEQLRQSTDFLPVVVCDEQTAHHRFPLDDVYANTGLPFPGLHQVINRVHRRLAYSNWPGTYSRILASHHPRLIHAHFGDRGVLMLALARHHRLPLVTTFYGYDVSKLPFDPRWRPRLRRLFAEGDLFLAEGPHMRDRLIALGCPAERTVIQHLGIDPARIAFRLREPSDGPVQVLMAASFREKKGLKYGIEAFARLARRRPGRVQLTIVGDGPLRAELQALAVERKIMPFIRWLGYQPHDVFLREARAAHVFLSPSVVAQDGDSEGGAPVTIIEAQATGLPILATSHADIPEVTRPGVSAFLVPERDIEALDERLTYLVDHPEAWAAMGRAGREHVVREFNSRELGRRLDQHYHHLLGAEQKGQCMGRK